MKRHTVSGPSGDVRNEGDAGRDAMQRRTIGGIGSAPMSSSGSTGSQMYYSRSALHHSGPPTLSNPHSAPSFGAVPVDARGSSSLSASTGGIMSSAAPLPSATPPRLDPAQSPARSSDGNAGSTPSGELSGEEFVDGLMTEVEEMKHALDEGQSAVEIETALWSLLTRLEHFKSTMRLPSSPDAESGVLGSEAVAGSPGSVSPLSCSPEAMHARQRFETKLAELKTSLLPLVIATSTEPTGMASSEHHGIERENEIACFNERLHLQLHAENWETLQERSSKTDISNVVSVSGDTHVGKSTLISSLLASSPKKIQGPELAAAQQAEPTTANVNYFDHEEFSEDVRRVRLLDLEGENGGKPPKTALSQKLVSLLDAMGVIQYQEQRRKAVAENLARLAFVVSDVVLFVWNESFANASYMQRVRKLAYDSTEGVDSANSPALILVYNKCGLDEQFDIDRCTADFFSNEENTEILQLYSDVKCICIPHMDQMKKIRMQGRSTRYIDGEEIYALQIRKLADLINGMLKKRMEQREMQGSLFSERVWCILVRLVIERFHKKLRMGDILSNIMKPRDYVASKVFDFFRETYTFVGKFRKDVFLQCREAAVQMLACMCVEHLREKQEQFDKYCMNTLKSETFQTKAKTMLRDLLEHIDRLAPCEAVYPGSTPGQPIYCTEERMMHGPFHRTCERVMLPSTSKSRITQFSQNVQYWIGIGYRPTWEGEHEMVYPDEVSQTEVQVLEYVSFLSQVISSNFFLTKVSIVQKAVFLARRFNSDIRNRPCGAEYCWICLENLATRKLSGCSHQFCKECCNRLLEVLRDQIAVTLNEEQEEASGFVSHIRPHQCPICHHSFTGSVAASLQSVNQQLQRKFESIFSFQPEAGRALPT